MKAIDSAGSITSRKNPKVIEAAKLRKRSGRDALRMTVVDEVRVLERALAAGWRPQTVFFASGQPGVERLLQKSHDRGATLYSCSAAVMEKMSFRRGSLPLVAVGPGISRSLGGLLLPPRPLLLVAENIQKPGNAGALARLADGAGADAMFMCGGTDLLNPAAIRNSTGAIFSLPVVETSSAAAINYLRERDIRICAAAPGMGASIFDVDLAGPVALVVGSEHSGLGGAWLKEADSAFSIPMLGVCDSLNVSAAAAVLLYEARRQRG